MIVDVGNTPGVPPIPPDTYDRTKAQSFKEQLDKHFPVFVHPTLQAMGANTVEDAYVIQIEDLIKEPRLTVVTARHIFALLQHHCVHKEYPADLNVPIPHAVTNSINVPLKSKSVQAFPKFSGLLEDWLAWKKETKAILGFNGWLQVATHKVLSCIHKQLPLLVTASGCCARRFSTLYM